MAGSSVPSAHLICLPLRIFISSAPPVICPLTNNAGILTPQLLLLLLPMLLHFGEVPSGGHALGAFRACAWSQAVAPSYCFLTVIDSYLGGIESRQTRTASSAVICLQDGSGLRHSLQPSDNWFGSPLCRVCCTAVCLVCRMCYFVTCLTDACLTQQLTAAHQQARNGSGCCTTPR
jgi:hypothetical protein